MLKIQLKKITFEFFIKMTSIVGCRINRYFMNEAWCRHCCQKTVATLKSMRLATICVYSGGARGGAGGGAGRRAGLRSLVSPSLLRLSLGMVSTRPPASVLL